MGPVPSQFEVTTFNPRDWKVEKENGYCLLLRNTHTGEIVEEYDMLPKGDLTIQ